MSHRPSHINRLLCCFAVLFVTSFYLSAEEMPANYYTRANGTQDAELKDSLKAIIRKHTSMTYGTQTWKVFYYADQDEEGYCMDMYCDTWYKFDAPGEKVTGCNIEHSFAKSWWGGAENDAYEDCYHLNPSNSAANSARSNFPLGIPQKDIKTAGSLRIGKIYHDSIGMDFSVFEPKDEYKGDFARAYFYMATCYGRWSNGTIDPVCSAYKGWRIDNPDVGSKFAMQNDNYLEFQPWEQEVLINWHRQDPVSIKEIRRQDAVSNFQHNRNPYIDYPYLAEYIWGERAGEKVDWTQLIASSDDAFVPGVSNGLRDGSVLPQKAKYGIQWSVNGQIIRVDSVIENKKIPSMPEDPTSCSTESDCFMGWTPQPINGSTNEEPERLYKKVTEIPSVTTDRTLYAVFAKKTVYDGGEPATYTFDYDNRKGWTTNANYTSFWLLDQGKTLVSPEVNLAGLSSIKVRIRTFGGKQYNTLNISANGETIATITTNTGTTMTDYTWTNEGALYGNSPITFSTDYGIKQGIGIESAVINATGQRVVYSDYITSCDGVATSIKQNTLGQRPNVHKVIKNGRLLIIREGKTYTITGQLIQ